MSFSDKANIQKLVKLDLQQKNKFKLLMIPSMQGISTINSGSGALGAGLALAGNLVTTLYCQSVEFPSSLNLEYDEVGKYVKMINRPEDIKLTFIEDEKATVWRYLQTWRKSIAYAAPPSGGFFSSAVSTLFSSKVEYVLADNQAAGERIGILLLGNIKGTGYKFPRIMFYGLKFKGLDNLTIGYTEENNLTYSLTLAVLKFALLFEGIGFR